MEPAEGFNLPLNDPQGLNATLVTYTNQGNLCGQAEYRQAGELLGTAFVARDIKAIFEALGEDSLIRYLGFSWGTLLGVTLAAMFPDKIDRMVLDGNINPTDYYHGTMEESVDDTDAALLHFFETCATAGPDYCPLATIGYTGKELQDDFYTFLEDTRDKSHNETDDTGETTEYTIYDSLRNELFGMLYAPSTWPATAEYIALLYQNKTPSVTIKRDFDPLAAADEAVPMALTAITCGDWDDIPGDLEDFKEWLALYQDRSKLGGDVMVHTLYQCSTWQVNAKEKFGGHFTDIVTKTPILFVNGAYDPVTPLVSAQNSSSGFVGSRVLRHNGAGHCSSSHPSSCVYEKVASYFNTGELPDVDQICEPNFPAFMGNLSAPIDSRTKRSVEEDRFETAVGSMVHLLGKRDPVLEYPAALKRAKRDFYEGRATATTSVTVIPAGCTPVSENTGGTLSDAQMKQGLSDLKDICGGYTEDQWFFQLICGVLG